MAEYGKIKSITEVPFEERENRVLYNAPGYSYPVLEKVNYFSDDAGTIQEKLNLDYMPFMEEPKTTELGKAAKYGFSSAVSGAVYNFSGIPGWTDSLADYTLEKLGYNPDQWKFDYVNGENIALDTNQGTLAEREALKKQFLEKEKFKNSLDESSLKNIAFYALAGIDSFEDYLRDTAETLGPEHMFNLGQDYVPDTIAEQVVAGFAGAPIMIAEYGAYTAAAIGGLAAVGIPGAVVGGSALAFGTVGFLGSYEQPWAKVFSNTAMGAIEGAAFGSVGKLNGWATRSIALGAIGAASAKMHGGGTTEVISGAITLAGLGFAGPMIGLKRQGEGAFTAPPKAAFTSTPAYSSITHDSARLSAHAEPLTKFIKTNGKGYHKEIEPLPFEFAELSKKELTKRDKRDKVMRDTGNVEPLIATKATQRAIENGKELIPFKRTKPETKKEEIDVTKGEKPVTEKISIPRDQVILDGKFLDLTVHINARTKNVVPTRKTPEVKKPKSSFDELNLVLSARTSNSKVAAENVSIARDLSQRYGLKFLGEGAKVEVKLSQIQAIAKSRKKSDAWAKELLPKIVELKTKKENNLNKRLTSYQKAIDKTQKAMGRLAVASINLRPDPGESPFKHFRELENALLDTKGKIKLDKQGNPIEVDLTGKIGGLTGKIFNFAETFGLPAKLAGDPSKNAFMRFVTTGVKNTQRAIEAGKDDILYKRLIDPTYKPDKTRFIEENPGITQGGVLYSFGNVLGKIKTFKSKEGAWTQFELLLKQKGKKEGVETANRIIKAMVKREVIMEKRAMLAAGGKKAKKEKVEKLLLSKREDGSYVFQMTYDRMASEFKLTKQEVDIIRNLDRGLAEARIYHNRSVKENPEVGATIIPERPNYFPRVWNGRHRIYIKEPGKEGQMIHAIAGKTEKEVYGIYDTFIKANPQYKNHVVNYELKSDLSVGRRENMNLSFDESIRLWDKKNPDVAALLKEAQVDYLAARGFGARKVARKDVGGYVGTGKEGRRLLEDFTDAYIGYIDGAVRGAEAIRFRGRIEPVIGGRSKFNDLIPQQVSFAKKYVDNAFGRDASYFAKKGDKLIETIADSAIFKKFGSPGTFQKAIQYANSFTLHKALLFFNPRFLYSQIVQPYQMGAQRLQFMKVEYGIKGDVGKAMVEGSYLPFKPTKEFRELITDAIKSGTIDTKFLKEFGIDARTGERIRTMSEEIRTKIWERSTGKRLSEMAERHSRLTALAMNYSFLKSGKYDVANGKQNMFNTAKWMTDNMMVEYNFTNRPMMYTHQGLGTIGSLFGLFKTFQHNYFGQVAQYARTYAKNPKSFEAASPLLMHAVSMVMTAGMFGIMAVNQIDFLLKQMDKAVQGGLKAAGVKNPGQYRIPEYTEMVLKLDIPIEQKFGVPSALVNADVSSTLAAPGIGVGDIFSLPTLDFLFGYTSKTNEGVIGNTFNMVMKGATGRLTDVDIYKFLKATSPPVLLAEVERRFAGVSPAVTFAGIDLFPATPDPEILKGEPITEARGRYMEFKNGRYIVSNPYKKMYGQIERDIGGFWRRYLGGRSFEESIILKSIWQSTKISMNHRDKIDALVTQAADNGYDGFYESIMFFTDAAIDLGYTQEQFIEKVVNRMEVQSNTVLSRLKAYGERYNMTRDDFIRSVIHNNNIKLAYPPGSE